MVSTRTENLLLTYPLTPSLTLWLITLYIPQSIQQSRFASRVFSYGAFGRFFFVFLSLFNFFLRLVVLRQIFYKLLIQLDERNRKNIFLNL